MAQISYNFTTDRQAVREWAERHDKVPVLDPASDGYNYHLVGQDHLGDAQKQRSWEEFFEAVDQDNKIFVYRDKKSEGGVGEYDLVDRSEAVKRAALADEDVVGALAEGETVTTEITETRIVETEVIETNTIESEILDKDVVQSDTIDRELQNRDVRQSKFLNYETVELEVEETWLITNDVTYRLLVESRVVDIHVESHEDAESEPLRANVDIEGVERTILDSDLVETETTNRYINTDVIQSEFVDEKTIESQLIEDQITQERVRERKWIRFTLAEADTIESEVIDATVVESEIVDGAFDEQTLTGETVESPEDAEASDPTTGNHQTVTFTDDDRGKDVVDEDGEAMGMVTAVGEDTLYVNPNPSLTEKLMVRLGWGETDEETYSIDEPQVRDITDDKIIVEG